MPECTSPTVPLSDAIELSLLKYYFAGITKRKLPYVIVGLQPDLLVYTNVHPDRFDRYLQPTSTDAYHFIFFRNGYLPQDRLYQRYPELTQSSFVVNGPLWTQQLARTFEPLPWIKTPQKWSLEMVTGTKETPDDPVADTEESGEEKAEPVVKIKDVVWLKPNINFDPVYMFLEYLKQNVSDRQELVKFHVDLNKLDSKAITYFRISEHPLDYIGLLKYYIRYPLMEGFTHINTSSCAHKQRPKVTTSDIVTWVDMGILRAAMVCECTEFVSWSYMPNFICFPNKRNPTQPNGVPNG